MVKQNTALELKKLTTTKIVGRQMIFAMANEIEVCPNNRSVTRNVSKKAMSLVVTGTDL